MGEPGALVAHYEIDAQIGEGAMGSVYRARDTKLGRVVALKILDAKGASPALVERFTREAQNAARLRHPGIVTGYDAGRDGDRLYIAMELVTGVALDAWAGAGRDSRPESRWSSGPPAPSTRPTRRESCTATSSRRTSSSTARGSRASSTSGCRARWTRSTARPGQARRWGRRCTCRRSRCAATCARSARGATSTRAGPSCTSS